MNVACSGVLLHSTLANDTKVSPKSDDSESVNDAAVLI